jgi:hypothetical protein
LHVIVCWICSGDAFVRQLAARDSAPVVAPDSAPVVVLKSAVDNVTIPSGKYSALLKNTKSYPCDVVCSRSKSDVVTNCCACKLDDAVVHVVIPGYSGWLKVCVMPKLVSDLFIGNELLDPPAGTSLLPICEV